MQKMIMAELVKQDKGINNLNVYKPIIMKTNPLLYALIMTSLLLSTLTHAQKKLSKIKKEAVASVNRHQASLIKLSDEVWANAETALKEYKSTKILADYAEKQGFKVERAVAGMPTAFIASYGSGKPIIGVLGEFDALPGISQKAISSKEALNDGEAGHGCGHNLLGAGGLGAAIAVKELIEAGKLFGTIRYYGTPAEESVGGKIYMVREGLFNDIDICLDWHPSREIKANVQSSKALIDFNVEFFGKAAHASADPWNGRSAADAAELFVTGVNTLREHIRPSVRIHYITKYAGDVPNVVPEYANIWIWIRDSKRVGVDEVYKRVQQIAKGAALMADVKSKVRLNGGDYEVLVNRTGGKVMDNNLRLLGPITYTNEEIEFAKQIQKATGKEQTGMDEGIKPFEETIDSPFGASTDVGDVSWVVPEIRLAVSTAPKDTPWHSWPVVACGGMSIGHKGMIYAAKAQALTIIDLLQDEQLRKDIRTEFNERKGDFIYKSYLPDGPPPVPEVHENN